MSVKKSEHLGILNLAFRCPITLPNTRAQPHTRKLQYPHARSTYAVPQVPESLLEALRRHSKLHGPSIDFLRVRASAPLQTQIRILDVWQSPRGRTHFSYIPKLYTFKLLVASRRPGPVASGIHPLEPSHGPCVAWRHARCRASTMCCAVQRTDGASACSNTIPFSLPFPRSTWCDARWGIKFYIWSSADRSHRTHKLDILLSAHHSRRPTSPHVSVRRS